MPVSAALPLFFFFNDTATTEIYTLSLHDALPISPCAPRRPSPRERPSPRWRRFGTSLRRSPSEKRSEEHTSELQSHHDLVCRLLLEKKKKSRQPCLHARVLGVAVVVHEQEDVLSR